MNEIFLVLPFHQHHKLQFTIRPHLSSHIIPQKTISVPHCGVNLQITPKSSDQSEYNFVCNTQNFVYRCQSGSPHQRYSLPVPIPVIFSGIKSDHMVFSSHITPPSQGSCMHNRSINDHRQKVLRSPTIHDITIITENCPYCTQNGRENKTMASTRC